MNTTPTVLIADELSPAAVAVFAARGVKADVKTGLKPEALAEIIGNYDGLAIRSATKVTAAILESAPRLKVIGRAGIGVDNVDVPAASSRGVVVMNTPFGNSITTAEHTIAMMMALARQLPAANLSTQAGKWEKSRFMGVELCAKVLGIIGCGNIGAIVADRAQGLKMRVIAFDPYLSEARALELGVEKVNLDDLLARADFITLHTPLTEGTRNILNAETLARTKAGVRIVNCARGGLIDEAALHAALLSGHVAGAALDVFAVEPAKESPLFSLEQVICTPHLGAATHEAQENVAVQIAEQISDFLTSGAVENALNMPSVSAEDAPKLKPYMKLTEFLGGLAGQALQGAIKTVTVSYQGAVTELNLRPLTAIALMGVLKPGLDSVNMVNAPVIARERGINLHETRSEQARDYHTIIRLDVVAEGGSFSVAGTIIGQDKPRLVAINDVAIEAEPAHHMLFTSNRDRPGYIGALGTTLAAAGVNIASFNLGRTAPGEMALCLVAVDQAVNDGLLAQVAAIENVVSACRLHF